MHWLGDPWGVAKLAREDQIDLMAYREVLLSNDQVGRAARKRVNRSKATSEDLRLLSLSPMTEGDYLHARLILTPKRDGSGGREDPYQTSGAEQFAKVLAQRDDEAARFWLQKMREGKE